jgi:hypothetical protein
MGRERNLVYDHRITDFTPTTHIKGTVNSEGIRKMTPREWARLQGFPDKYVIPVADASAYKQFGNSVAVPAIQATANKILELIGIKNGQRIWWHICIFCTAQAKQKKQKSHQANAPRQTANGQTNNTTEKKQLVTRVWQKWRFSAPQTHLWLIKVWFSASTFVVKIATFAKPETVMSKRLRLSKKTY